MKKKIKITLIILLFLLTGCYSAIGKEGQQLKVMIISDLHHLYTEFYDDGEVSDYLRNLRDGKETTYTDIIAKAVVEKAKEDKVDALIISGDLTFNGEYYSHKELTEILEPLLQEGIKVLVIPGNHDINNPFAYSYYGETKRYQRTVTSEEFREIYKNYGYKDSTFEDRSSLSYVYRLSDDVWFLMLDTSIYEANSGFGLSGKCEIREKSLKWIKKMFKEAKKKNAILIPVTHECSFPNEYINNASGYILTNGEELRNLMVEYDSPLAISGHLHVQMILQKRQQGKTLYDVSQGSICVPGNLYGLLTINPHESIDYQAINLDVTKYALANNLEDENLKDFYDFGFKHFQEVSYNLFYSDYLGSQLEQEEMEDLAYLHAYLNPYYYCGQIDKIKEIYQDVEGYQTYLKYHDELNYIERMIGEDKIDQLHLTVELKD